MPNLYVVGGTKLKRDCHCSQIGNGMLHSALGPSTIHRVGDWPFGQVQQSNFHQKWFRAFRINWGFHYAKLAMECALSNSDIDRNVLIMRKMSNVS